MSDLADLPADGPSLLERIARGDADAVRQLVDRYGPTLRAMARRRLEPSLAEDVVQEIFLSLWRSAARFEPSRASEAAFVTTIAQRRIVDLRRRQSKRRETDLEEAHDVADAAGPDRAELLDEAGAAMAALASLPLAARSVLRMAVVEGLTHAEIASSSRLPLGTVKSHVRRGLERLRTLLARRDAASGPGEPDPERDHHG